MKYSLALASVALASVTLALMGTACGGFTDVGQPGAERGGKSGAAGAAQGGSKAGGGASGAGGAPIGLGGDQGTANGPSTGGNGATDGGGTCSVEKASCANGETCCAGLECCAGVPVPAGNEYCGEVCPKSDVNIKRDFVSVDPNEVLDKLSRLPVGVWSYRTEGSTVRHIGPLAQDFMATFGVGSSDRTILQVDADGVSFAAIQALNARLARLEEQNKKLESELAEQRRRCER